MKDNSHYNNFIYGLYLKENGLMNQPYKFNPFEKWLINMTKEIAALTYERSKRLTDDLPNNQ